MAASQPANWTFTPTSKAKSFSFSINNLFYVNGKYESPSIGDCVGIFTKINNAEKCVGYTLIKNDTANFTVLAYGRDFATDSTSSGYIYNSTFKIHWWRKTRNCQIVGTYPDSTQKLDSIASPISVNQVMALLPSAFYTSSSYNISTDSNPSPTISNILTDIRFKSSSVKLQLDSSLGTINLKASGTGSFKIKMSSQYCLQNDSLTIVLTDSLPSVVDTSKAPILDYLSFDILSPGCKTLGSIHFKLNTIAGKKPFTFKLSTNYSLETFTNLDGRFEELREGNYQLTVVDSTGKASKYKKVIALEKKEDCTSAILAPNSKDGLQAIFIPEQGTANILDREGRVIKQLAIPAEWDGRDAKGEYVPMGDYYLFINEQQSKVITVIR